MELIGLRSVRNLEVLDLSNNGIKRVSSGPLKGLNWLVELKLDDNRICKVQVISQIKQIVTQPNYKILLG